MSLPAKFAALVGDPTDEPPPAVDWRKSPNFLPTLQEVSQMKAEILRLERELALARAQAHDCHCANCPQRPVL